MHFITYKAFPCRFGWWVEDIDTGNLLRHPDGHAYRFASGQAAMQFLQTAKGRKAIVQLDADNSFGIVDFDERVEEIKEDKPPE